MSENTTPAQCSEVVYEAARAAGLIIVTTGEEAAIQKFAAAIQAAAYADGRADEREAIAQLCAEEAANMRKEGEGCRDARYDWMAQGAEALADTLRGINSASGTPADPVLAAGWMPIASAPKDGTHILLSNGVVVAQGWWEHKEPYIRERRDIEGRYIDQDESDGFDGWLDCEGGMLPEPTHWMPLPKHPDYKPETVYEKSARWAWPDGRADL